MTKKRKQQDFNSEDTLYNKRSRPSQNDGGGDDGPSASQTRVDPTYGQRGAFPGLDDHVGNDELFYGPANDGLEYLRMVRSEAKAVPNLLVAPVPPSDQPEKDGLYEEYPQGYYADGAYTAAPLPSTVAARRAVGDEEDEDVDPQDAYYNTLCARFAALSSILEDPPPASDVTSNPPSFSRPKIWRNKILKVAPKMVVLAQIPQDMVILGLEVLEDVLTASHLRSTCGHNIGAWAWGLLARCRDVGMMGSEEVGAVRKLGKKAVWLLRRIAAGEVVEEEPAVENDAREGAHDEEEDDEVDLVPTTIEINSDEMDAEEYNEGWINQGGSNHQISPDLIKFLEEQSKSRPPRSGDGNTEPTLAEAKRRVLSYLESTSDSQAPAQIAEPPVSGNENQRDGTSEKVQDKPDRQSNNVLEYEHGHEGNGVLHRSDEETVHATLDMIVTIVGEFYGQRDLLDGRLLWDEIA